MDFWDFWSPFIAGAAVAGFVCWAITYWWATRDWDAYRDDDWWWKAPDYPPDDLEPNDQLTPGRPDHHGTWR